MNGEEIQAEKRSRHLSRANVMSELHRLCRNGDLSAIKSYLNEAIMSNVINQVAGENGCTPLHEAAMAGRGDVVRLLREECREALDVETRTQHGPASTALHLAAERGHTECVVALLDCGAAIEAVDRRWRTAKDVARENGKRQVVQVITLSGRHIVVYSLCLCCHVYVYICVYVCVHNISYICINMVEFCAHCIYICAQRNNYNDVV